MESIAIDRQRGQRCCSVIGKALRRTTRMRNGETDAGKRPHDTTTECIQGRIIILDFSSTAPRTDAAAPRRLPRGRRDSRDLGSRRIARSTKGSPAWKGAARTFVAFTSPESDGHNFSGKPPFSLPVLWLALNGRRNRRVVRDHRRGFPGETSQETLSVVLPTSSEQASILRSVPKATSSRSTEMVGLKMERRDSRNGPPEIHSERSGDEGLSSP